MLYFLPAIERTSTHSSIVMKSTSLKFCFVLALLNAFVTYRNWIAGVGGSLWRAFKQPQAMGDGEGVFIQHK